MPPSACLILATAVAGLCLACHPAPYARVMPLGEPLPSREADCELTYDEVAPTDAQAQRQVGQVCVSANGPSSHQARSVDDVYGPGDMRELLTARACALGGERVAPIGLCSNGQINAIAFGVYVPR
jgi:hypothetical protein